jgi:hypothetical protein
VEIQTCTKISKDSSNPGNFAGEPPQFGSETTIRGGKIYFLNLYLFSLYILLFISIFICLVYLIIYLFLFIIFIIIIICILFYSIFVWLFDFYFTFVDFCR